MCALVTGVQTCALPISGAGDRDRSFELGRAVARGELGHACGAFDGDIGGDLTQQPTRDQHTESPVALGERRRQAQPKLLSLIVVVIVGRKLIGAQGRRLFLTRTEDGRGWTDWFRKCQSRWSTD